MVSGFLRGVFSYKRAFGWLKDHPSSAALLLIPFFTGLVAFWYVGLYFVGKVPAIMDYFFAAVPAENFFWALLTYYIPMGILYPVLFVMAAISGFIVSFIVCSPIYEVVSCRVEASLSGGKVEEISLFDIGAMLGVMKTEAIKLVFIALVSVFLLLIPFLQIVSFLVSALLFGWDFFDYLPARRGYGFRRRLKFVLSEAPSVLGLGSVLLIPFVQFFIAPVAVVAGTMLAVDATKSLD